MNQSINQSINQWLWTMCCARHRWRCRARHASRNSTFCSTLGWFTTPNHQNQSLCALKKQSNISQPKRMKLVLSNTQSESINLTWTFPPFKERFFHQKLLPVVLHKAIQLHVDLQPLRFLLRPGLLRTPAHLRQQGGGQKMSSKSLENTSKI